MKPLYRSNQVFIHPSNGSFTGSALLKLLSKLAHHRSCPRAQSLASAQLAVEAHRQTPHHSPVTMIRFILLQNRQGKTRLAKYYIPLEDSEKHKLEYEVHRLVVNRDPKFTNFVEFRTHKVIYRRYAGLFFSLCVDITDNELAYLESIHLFVEILDHFFSNVCELDLVFNFHKVYLILDEFILAGELQETSKKAIIERMGELEKQD
uniref:AP-2 complex subunit sigma n=2 Tax=Physcomitrium patens TaxID=3218 RepID=A0A7I4ER34_PHYPA